MANDDNINVSYDRSGVPLPDENNIHGFSEELSNYLYPKLNTIENKTRTGETEFSNTEINNYGLNIVNNKIDISSTKKLINYLKAISNKIGDYVTDNINEIYTQIEYLSSSKLNISDYNIDDTLGNSGNPVSNNAIYNKFQEIINSISNLDSRKANIQHTHSMSEISNLTREISGLGTSLAHKADKSLLSNHTNQQVYLNDNPHGINDALNSLKTEISTWEKIDLGNYNNYATLYVNKLLKLAKFRYSVDSYTASSTGRVYLHKKNMVIPAQYQPKTTVGISIPYNEIFDELIVSYTGTISVVINRKGSAPIKVEGIWGI